ncbi:DUF7312 domain-containing protein [Halopiger djelfimassiliensis]|uniref:DUF7312 domain-containing protein n=1 Tax=Halopiger djelfimassiliensis TaxID=1293047 RepID=UPI000677F492|nr:hypothetical protein [Halopiger djelfimassiliensis]
MADDASGPERDEDDPAPPSRDPDGPGPSTPADGFDSDYDVETPSRTVQSEADSGSDESYHERIPIDLSGANGADEPEDDEYTPEPSSTPIEAGDPDLENAVFVLLGAIAMILLIVHMLSLPF